MGLQNHPVFKDRNLTIPVLFILRKLLAAGGLSHHINKTVNYNILFFPEQPFSVKIDPMGLLFRQSRVGGDLHRWNGGAERGSSTGGEEDDVCSGGRQGGGGDDIVTRS